MEHDSYNLSSYLSSHFPSTTTLPPKIGNDTSLQSDIQNLDNTAVDNLRDFDLRALLKRSMTVLESIPVVPPKRSRIAVSATIFFCSPSQRTIHSVSSTRTPKTSGVFAKASKGTGTTYTDAFNFLDDGDQTLFNFVFCASPTLY